MITLTINWSSLLGEITETLAEIYRIEPKMSWWENVVDAVPLVGTTYRTGRAIAAHVSGDHEEAGRQWTDAGMNLAGDALGVVTGGAGKVATTAAKVGAKTAVKAVAKAGVKQAVRLGGRAAVKAARKQLTTRAMKAYAKRYFKKKVKKAAKRAVKEAIEAYEDGERREEIIDTLMEAVGASWGELNALDDQELIELALTAVDYDEYA